MCIKKMKKCKCRRVKNIKITGFVIKFSGMTSVLVKKNNCSNIYWSYDAVTKDEIFRGTRYLPSKVFRIQQILDSHQLH